MDAISKQNYIALFRKKDVCVVEGVGAIEAKEFYSHCKVLGWGANRVTR
jgi:hypothetical protein